MSLFSSNFPTLPRNIFGASTDFGTEKDKVSYRAAGETSATKLWDANGVLIDQSASAEEVSADSYVTKAIKDNETLSLGGVYGSDIGTKAGEGYMSAVSKFGDASPFDKMTSDSPSFMQQAAAQTPGFGGNNQSLSATTLYGNISLGQKETGTGETAKQANSRMQKEDPAEDLSHIVQFTDGKSYVFFDVMPEVSEDRSVSYEGVPITQGPGAFQKYKMTDSVTWAINGIFIARTSEEATKNLVMLNTLRAWTMPVFGQHALEHDHLKNKLGAPPPVLKFKGLRKGIIGEVPVVITSLNWTWPRDVDYLPATSLVTPGETVPFPSVMSISIRVTESFSTTQINQFDLPAYYAGDMDGAYNRGFAPKKATAKKPAAQAKTSSPKKKSIKSIKSTVNKRIKAKVQKMIPSCKVASADDSMSEPQIAQADSSSTVNEA